MGCDCGCGGTCPICAGFLSRMIPEHYSTIMVEAKKFEKPKRKKGKKRNENKK